MRLSKEQFVGILKIIENLVERDKEFSKALLKFSNSPDFGMFSSDTPEVLVDWLSEVMEDKTEMIAYYLWECDEEHPGLIKIDEKEYVVKTPEDVYDCIGLLQCQS